ncbi:N-acetylmuramoyl-L-alanine amidase [Oceanobacillus sp. E9]|uniref:N-acetylmuramoyl-L-alanine amidase n=1 Tax=Oceanobacillus TaxID=182709 RepID=UPI00084ECD2C|nr:MULTISPECIES: N-acetylmuramoyl-L-alanine amidase [Oceanobacillus]OEH55547.1 N-acetylmuramoyl-L-alanine amidase [Oceanobacillus sp. E9]
MKLTTFLSTILFTLLFIFIFEQAVTADTAIVDGEGIHVRSGPGSEYDSIGNVNEGQSYPLVQQQNDWVEIDYNGESGWVSQEYINIEQTEQEYAEIDSESVETVYNNTHLRSGPSVNDSIIDYVDQGTTLNIVQSEDGWLEVEYEESTAFVHRDFITDTTKIPNNDGFKNKTIVIDAGHGGRDVGAIGTSNTYEKDFAFLTAQELASELTYLGADVHMTRSHDEFISLNSRASYANFVDTDAFISIHYNSVADLPNVTGIETFYYNEKMKPLAESVQQGMIRSSGDEDRGTSYGDFQILRLSLQPSLLLELGFISNKEQEALLSTTGYQKQLVSGILEGLSTHFNR